MITAYVLIGRNRRSLGIDTRFIDRQYIVTPPTLYIYYTSISFSISIILIILPSVLSVSLLSLSLLSLLFQYTIIIITSNKQSFTSTSTYVQKAKYYRSKVQ